MLLNEKKNYYLRTGLILTGLMAALALVGCVWTPYSPTAMSGSEKFLPSVTAADNGKFMCVANGAWSAVTVPDAEGGSY